MSPKCSHLGSVARRSTRGVGMVLCGRSDDRSYERQDAAQKTDSALRLIGSHRR
jgi:hypothetical protein